MHAPTTTTQTTTADTARPTVPPPPAGPSAPPRREARLWTGVGITAGILATALAAGSFIEIPYYEIAPGTARNVVPAVQIQGPEVYQPVEGELLFLTVNLDHVTLLQAVRGWLDPDTIVIPEERLLGDRTDAENRQFNQQLMADSKQIAAAVALARLGYDLHPTGTGAIVTDIVPDSPAEAVLELGDTVTAVDGTPVQLREQLGDLIAAHPPGTAVTLTVENLDRAARDVQVVLVARPDDAATAFLGVGSATRGFDPGLPFPVTIDSGQVGGPSAGLAFALTVIDLLTPGELTGGNTIAVTGTIEPDGTVGPVGGVIQKAATAADAGATVFLVPRDELEDAQAHSHGMRIIAVDTLEAALDALEALGGSPVPDATG